MSQPGWYNDEVDPTIVRWHDGAAWTEWVADKAHWEAIGHAPPPPDQVEPEPVGWVGLGRRAWVAIGAAVGAVVLVLAGVAVATSGHGGSGGSSSGDGPSRSAVTDTTSSTVAEDLVTDPSITGASESTEGTGGSSTSSGGAAARRSGGTTPTTKGSTVTRTETRTESHTNPSTPSSPVSGDKTSVGHTTNTSIHDTYTPPPTTASTATTTTVASSTTTPPTDPTTTGGITP